MCNWFAILDFVEGDILSIGQVTRTAMYVLKFASKIVVNVYFNNQKQAKDCVRKDSVESFKTRQRSK